MATPTIIKVVINDDNRAIYKIEASCIDETSNIDWGDGIKTRVLPGVYVYDHEYAKNGTYTIKLNNANLDKGWFVTEAIFGDYSSYLATCCLSGNFYEEQPPSILETVVLNEGLRVINYGALVDCTELKTLTIPSTVVEIGQNAFDNCTSLEKVYIKAMLPPERTKFGPSTPELKPIFADDDNLRAIYVPEGSVDAYKTAWYDYAHLIRRFPMFKIDEHIATITIEDEAVVQFSRQHPVYGIKGDNIKASFEEDFEDTDQGVYDTSATGTTIMENHQQKDTIYLKGTGTVTVWAGLSAVNFPFKARAKGGDAGGVIIGKEDGYILISDEADDTVIGAAAVATEIVVVVSSSYYYLHLYNTDTAKPVNALVDWGDGTTTEATGGEIHHSYNTTGEHTIKVYPFSADKLMISDVNYTATSVNVNTGIKYVYMEDFQRALTKATFADGVEAIQGFYRCDNLADVTIPDSVNQIVSFDDNQFAFMDTPYWDACTSNGLVIMGRVAVTATGDGQIAIPSGVWHINENFNGNYQFGMGKHNITSLSLPSGLKTIGGSAFTGSMESTLSSVTIPASVTSIGEGAFYYNISLASVTFANGSVLESIGDYAFYRCQSLTSITIPASVTSIGANAFNGCYNLTTLTLSSNLLTIGSDAFNGCKITSVTFPATVASIGANAFKGNKLTNITIPATVTSIGADAFANNSTLTEIHFAGSTPPTITAAIAPNTVYIFVPVGAVSAYEAAGYANVHEEGWQPPHDISLTWETGTIDPATGEDATDSMCVRSESTSDISEVYSVKWAGSYGDTNMYQLMVCCYNKSNGTYAGTYNGTSVVQGESWLHGYDDWSTTWNDDLSSLTAYDFRFVFKNKWTETGGAEQYVVVYGIE